VELRPAGVSPSGALAIIRTDETRRRIAQGALNSNQKKIICQAQAIVAAKGPQIPLSLSLMVDCCPRAARARCHALKFFLFRAKNSSKTIRGLRADACAARKRDRLKAPVASPLVARRVPETIPISGQKPSLTWARWPPPSAQRQRSDW
jgi:hypothetical protein